MHGMVGQLREDVCEPCARVDGIELVQVSISE
jgi:hypothetical protein